MLRRALVTGVGRSHRCGVHGRRPFWIPAFAGMTESNVGGFPESDAATIATGPKHGHREGHPPVIPAQAGIQKPRPVRFHASSRVSAFAGMTGSNAGGLPESDAAMIATGPKHGHRERHPFVIPAQAGIQKPRPLRLHASHRVSACAGTTDPAAADILCCDAICTALLQYGWQSGQPPQSSSTLTRSALPFTLPADSRRTASRAMSRLTAT